MKSHLDLLREARESDSDLNVNVHIESGKTLFSWLKEKLGQVLGLTHRLFARAVSFKVNLILAFGVVVLVIAALSFYQNNRYSVQRTDWVELPGWENLYVDKGGLRRYGVVARYWTRLEIPKAKEQKIVDGKHVTRELRLVESDCDDGKIRILKFIQYDRKDETITNEDTSSTDSYYVAPSTMGYYAHTAACSLALGGGAE